MYTPLLFILCSVISSKQTEWVKLPQIDTKTDEKYNGEFGVFQFAFGSDENKGFLSNITATKYSDVYNPLQGISATKNTINLNERVQKLDLTTAIIEVQTKPRHVGKIEKITKIPKIKNNATDFPNINKTDSPLENNNKTDSPPENNKPTTNFNENNAGSNSKSEQFDMNKFVDIISTIQKNIFSNIPKKLNSKLKFLKSIHNNILNNLDDQIGAVWTKGNRQKRGTKEGDSHVDFPSSESALMTIGFLTFSVFLIKLVMQLIYVLKAKKMISFSPMTAVGRSYDDNVKDSLHDTVRILRLMEDFKNKENA